MDQSTVIKAVREAVRSDNLSANKYVNAGSQVREFYGTETAINEVKAQFIADAIIPELDKKHQSALAKDLPRKGSADYVAFVANHGAAFWDDANQAKKDARAIAHTYFSRVVRYAWPKEPTERKVTPLQTRIINEVSALVKACQKAETPDFDVAKTIAALDAVLATVIPTK